MATAAASGLAQSEPGSGGASRIKMKELEALTGVGREAIRFYIREGMLPAPEKPKRNVAYYSDEHVTRLLTIRHLREEREMSLARIKMVLDSAEFERLAGTSTLRGVERLLPALLDGVTPSADIRLDELAAFSGLEPGEVDELVARGLIRPEQREGEHWVGFRDAGIAARWGRIRELGFTRARGYDLDILERYRSLTKELAEREVELFLAAFSGISADTAADAAAEALRNGNDILAQMHVGAVLDSLRRQLA